jgi:hypothetical protein
MRRVSVMRWINPPTWRYILTFTLVCLASYVAAGLVVAGVSFMRRASYSWLLVAVFGSPVLAVIYKFRLYPGGDGALASERLITLVGDALESAVWLSVFTLPFSAAFFYLSRAAGRRFLKTGAEWHRG